MSIGTTELLLVLRARDEASRTFSALSASMNKMDDDTKKAAEQQMQRGKALTSIGVGVTAIGLAGAKVLYDWTQAAIQYNKESALTLTQVDHQKISLQQIKQVGIDVARAIPAPFKEMQTSLYDIFSSMDVNLAGAKTLLTQFSKAAVAGQVDLQDASRATIGILNAYRMKVQDVNMVNDVMFQLVRKGVGTYSEFANTIGRSVPSAVRAGQSIQTLAGMLAFLTRNGLSAAMATASAGRALDAISNPKTIKNFHDLGREIEFSVTDTTLKRLQAMGVNWDKIGVAVIGANGKFRPMNDIMTDLGKTFAKFQLTAPDISATLHNVFLGAGGTIQARRFFDTAVKGFGDLNNLTSSMKNSSGAMQGAYDIMFKQPASQIQLLKNNWEIMKTQMGDALIPVLNKLVAAFITVFKWFDNLSAGTKKWIAYGALAATALTILVGVVLLFAGALAIMTAAAAALDIGLLPLIAIIALVILAFVAIGVAVYFIIKYWSPISGFFKRIWNDVYGAVKSALMSIWSVIKTSWNAVANVVTTAAKVIWTIIRVYVALWIVVFILAWRAIMGAAKGFWLLFGPLIKLGFKVIEAIWGPTWKAIRLIAQAFWDLVLFIAKTSWKMLSTEFQIGFAVISAIWKVAWGAISYVLKQWWAGITAGFDLFWSAIKQGFTAAKDAIIAIWNAIKKPLEGPVNFIINTVWNNGIRTAWNTAVKLVGLKGMDAPYVAPIHLASGGRVFGPGGDYEDKVPAMLSNNEFVVQAKQTRKWLPYLELINRGLVEPPGHYSLGGLVGDIGGAIGGTFSGIIHGAQKLIDQGLAIFAKAAFAPIISSLGILDGEGNWGKIVKQVPIQIMDKMLAWFTKEDTILGTGGATDMVKTAERYLGKGDIFSIMVNRPIEEWCADFVDAVAKMTGNSGVIPSTASAPGKATGFQQLGRYHTGMSGAGPGDIFFASHSGPGFGGIYHTGIVTASSDGSTLKSIAGNTGGNDVAYETWSGGIAGYGHPAYKSGGSFPGGSLVHASPAAAQAFARQALNDFGGGWGGQFSQLLSLWNQESGWRWDADNPSSGAYGIPQSLPASKMATAGNDWHDNAATQIKWGLGYIQSRYGSPAAAWNHEVSSGWYDNGGYLRPGYTLAYNGTGRNERVVSPAEELRSGRSVGPIIINTTEINPVKHAADLGWILARRS